MAKFNQIWYKLAYFVKNDHTWSTAKFLENQFFHLKYQIMKLVKLMDSGKILRRSIGHKITSFNFSYSLHKRFISASLASKKARPRYQHTYYRKCIKYMFMLLWYKIWKPFRFPTSACQACSENLSLNISSWAVEMISYKTLKLNGMFSHKRNLILDELETSTSRSQSLRAKNWSMLLIS